MLYLLETPVGIALFKERAFISDYKFKNTTEAVDFYKTMDEGTIPAEILQMLKNTVEQDNKLNILHPRICANHPTILGFNLFSEMDSVFRSLKNNAFKHFSCPKTIFSFSTRRLCHKLVNPSVDLVIVDLIDSIEELDTSINNRVMRIREWYSLHFPELNSVANCAKYLEYVIKVQDRKTYIQEESGNDIDQFLVSNSMGVDLGREDIDLIVENAKNILEDMEFREKRIDLLKLKCEEHFPNMSHIIDCLLIAKLIRKAGSLSQLACQASSTIQIYGAEKSFNAAIKEKGNTPKYGIIFDSGYISRASDKIKGKIARMLANKIALCAKVDLAGEMKDGSFGLKMKNKLDNILNKLEDFSKMKKKIHHNQKQVITIKQYNTNRDVKRTNK